MEGAKFDQQKEEFMNVDGEAEVDVDIMKELRSGFFCTLDGGVEHSVVKLVQRACLFVYHVLCIMFCSREKILLCYYTSSCADLHSTDLNGV